MVYLGTTWRLMLEWLVNNKVKVSGMRQTRNLTYLRGVSEEIHTELLQGTSCLGLHQNL